MEIDLDQSTQQMVRSILDGSGSNADAVARHLVGATLQVRFADSTIEVTNSSHPTANAQLGRLGDILISDTVFHITMSPTPSLLRTCASNVTAGFRPYLLVPDHEVETARDLAAVEGILGHMDITSIGQFVGQMLDFMSAFSRPKLRASVQRLIECYNARVQAVESDPSFSLEIYAGFD